MGPFVHSFDVLRSLEILQQGLMGDTMWIYYFANFCSMMSYFVL